MTLTDRRTLLKRAGALTLGAWAAPALMSVNVAEAVGSAAPAGGTAQWVPVDSDQVLHAGSATVTIYTAYAAFGQEGSTTFPAFIGDDRVMLAGDPLGASGPLYRPGVFFIPWRPGSGSEWQGPGDGALPEQLPWLGSGASWGHYAWAVRRSHPGSDPETRSLTWGDVWLVRQRLT